MVTRELLKKFSIFADLPEQILQEILQSAEMAPYAPGEVIVPFGQPFTFFGLLVEGEANAYLTGQEGNLHSIETLTKGSTIGEMSLLTGLSSPVDLIATTPCRVLMMPADLFHTWVQAEPKTLQRFSKSIARRSTVIEQERQRLRQQVAEERADADPYGLGLTPDDPQRLLVLNLRTGSLKYRFFDTDDESRNVEGQVEWIGEARCTQTHATTNGEYTFQLGELDHRRALEAALDRMVDPEIGVLDSLDEITAVGHRVVHGADKYSSPVVIDEAVLEDIRSFAYLAPLHNPMHALGIEWCQELLPDIPHV
ncbi:MAG: cyclic nucleotide-binding domain-containing protein, partial [Anaerolineae bacterium]